MEKKKVTEPKAEVKPAPETPKAEVVKAEPVAAKPAFHHTFKAADVESPVDEDPKIKEYQKQLDALRQDGTLKIYHLKEEMYDVRRKQMIDELTRKKILDADKAATIEARKVEKQNAAEVSRIIKEASAYVKEVSNPFEAKMKTDGTELVNAAKPGHEQKLSEIKSQYESSLVALKEKNAQKLADFEAKKPAPAADPEQDKVVQAQYKRDLNALKKENNAEIQSLRVTYRSSINDENNSFNAVKQQRKEMIYGAYLARYNKMNDLRGGRTAITDTIEHKFKTNSYNFNWGNFLLSNALYIVVIVFFIACFITAPIIGKGNILTADNIYGFLETASSRMFFALGVAGLIVLGGTDLSVGRMIGLGTLCVGFVLHSGDVPAKIFGNTINMDSMAMPVRVFLALFLSIFATTLFSTIAGFFSAKFKMHPFITTLATMMIAYGLMYVATDGVPTGNPNANGINTAILGRLSGGFPKYVFYAVAAIAVVWFIWNKTKFGKNMFAVGGNAEAASVSGISYFAVTLGVFIMAGVLYGFGTFFYAFYSNPAANTGYGYELDAIAACVVGGISFFGGIGKVSGAVIGCLIFAGLTYVLTLMGVSSYWQFVIKGVILMSAVALDSLKYLKKK
jgi:methyl-galactoside transport system permease protein